VARRRVRILWPKRRSACRKCQANAWPGPRIQRSAPVPGQRRPGCSTKALALRRTRYWPPTAKSRQ
jgi:hypothetical protein